MDHVLNTLRDWLQVYQERDDQDRDRKAEKAIQAAIDTIYREYYGMK